VQHNEDYMLKFLQDVGLAAGRAHAGENQKEIGRSSRFHHPPNHGENVVMRVLDESSLLLGLPELGFFSDDQNIFERLI